jgi:cytochrome c
MDKSSPPPPDVYEFVAVDPAAAETLRLYCRACHAERLVAQRRLTRQDWEEVIDLMVEAHGMAPIENPAPARVLGYLSTPYGPDRPNYPLP